jgi:hypothetical protein
MSYEVILLDLPRFVVRSKAHLFCRTMGEYKMILQRATLALFFLTVVRVQAAGVIIEDVSKSNDTTDNSEGGSWLLLDVVSSSSSNNNASQLVQNNTQYYCVFRSLWTPEHHPVDFPDKAQWSSPVLLSHAKRFIPFEENKTTTLGVQRIAQVRSLRVQVIKQSPWSRTKIG